MSGIPEEELRENFDHFDADGDGYIDLAEFGHLMEALDALEPGESPKIGFRAIDTDGSGKVDFEEFARWFDAR